ncbi:MAG: FG-GAP repeat protein [Deltaproteobacteria bacterium]|nr:FG-GAP repeat protein [Deltaproteobacteria bacterium]
MLSIRNRCNVGISAAIGLATIGSACSEQQLSEGADIIGETIQGAAPAGHNASFNVGGSDFPLTWSPGEKRLVTIQMDNNGTNEWSSAARLYSRMSPLLRWGWASTYVSSSVPVAGSNNFTFRVRAPADGTPPNNEFRAQMTQSGYFGDVVLRTVSIDGANKRMWDCAATSDDLPATMQQGDIRTVNIEVQNTGTATWPAGAMCFRVGKQSPLLTWGANTCVSLPVDVAPDEFHTFSFSIQAPTGETGPIAFTRQMFGTGNTPPTGIGYFDDIANCFNGSINVSADVAYDSSVVSEDFPVTMVAGSEATVTVDIDNTGTQDWNGFALYSENSPLNLWGVAYETLPATASGGTAEVQLHITAPTTLGAYKHKWRVIGFDGVGFFGEAIDIDVNVVAGCGNGIIESPETCDDGNTTPNDGCDASCNIEATSVDLAVTPATRTFSGSGLITAQSTVDLNGDGIRDIVLGQSMGLNAAGTNRSPYAGAIVGYAGTSSFFSSASTAIPTGAWFWISGAEREDYLGSNSDTQIASGNVFSDENGLVVTAAGADGTGNARPGAGEVYVFRASQLSGFIDLEATPGAPAVTIIGPSNDSHIRVLDVVDADADGIADILIGAPGASPGGRSGAGAAYLIAGGLTLAGTIDLATVTAPQLLAYFVGPNDEDALGAVGAMGDFQGSGSVDVVFGLPGYDQWVDRGGAAFTVAGPLSGNYDMAIGTDYDARFFVLDLASVAGTSVAVGNVIGDSRADLIIGGRQILNPDLGVQAGAVGVVQGPVASADYFVSRAAGFNSAFDTIFFGEDFGDNFGTALALGNYNNDTRMDLLVSAYAADGPGNARSNAGAAYLLVGRATFPATIDLELTAAERHVDGAEGIGMLGRFRQSITMGDLNNDGSDDFCVANGNGTKSVYCFRSDL